ncbi:MAG: nitroreductase family deazaflavin-dependent oxidoreductase [Actinomycetota bacterium]
MHRLAKVMAAAVGVVVGVVIIEEIFETALTQWAFKGRNPRVLGWLTSYHKHVTNPVMVRFFSGRSARNALLHHVGRRSGKPYATPLTAHRSEDTIIVPLPYGTETDWLRNLQAAGQGVVELESRSFTVEEPEVVLIDEVMALLPPFVVRIVRMHEIKHALRLHVAA